MSFSNTVVFNTYSGNGIDVTFNFTFNFLAGEDHVKVKVYEVQSGLASEITPTPSHTIDEGAQQVIFTAAPTGTQLVVLFRETETLQETEYNDYRFPFDTVERHFDRVVQMVQEHDKMLETAELKDYYNPNGNTPDTKYVIREHTNGDIDANDGELIYLTDPTNTVTVILPALPDPGDEVVIKEASGAIANKSVDPNGSVILGVSGNYDLQSIYESVRLVYSASGWLLI